jgi:hypothetical protein
MQLARCPEEELGRHDIAAVNLACAEGLPGVPPLDIPASQRRIDAWTERVRADTARWLPRFHADPATYGNSPGKFRMIALFTVLQRDLGIAYRPGLTELPDAEFFADAGNMFIHAIVQGRGGACASLPVLFIAVGRRLGYPLKLVHTGRHLFARWEGQGEVFNVECTSPGFNSYPDDFYKRWPEPITDERIRDFGFLRSLTPRQELSGFLGARGRVFLENGCLSEAARAFAYACDLDFNKGTQHDLSIVLGCWQREMARRLMPGFPLMLISKPPRRLWPNLPPEAERAILVCQTQELLLSSPRWEREWWGPLRRDPSRRPWDLPAFVQVRYPQAAGQSTEITFYNQLPQGFAPTHPC